MEILWFASALYVHRLEERDTLFPSLSVLQDTPLLQEASLRDAQQMTALQLPPVSDFRQSP